MPLGGATETGADRINKNQIGHIQPGLIVVNQMVRRRTGEAIGPEFDSFWSDGAEMKPDGRGAGAAVENEGNRPRRGIGGGLLHVGDEKEIRLGFAGVVLECDRASGGLVVDLLAANGDGMIGHGELVLPRRARGGRLVCESSGRLWARAIGEQKSSVRAIGSARESERAVLLFRMP